jgi:hypothetical protein
VCDSDYGMLSDMAARGEQLLEQADSPETPPESPQQPENSTHDAIGAIADALDLPRDNAAAAFQAIAAEAHPDETWTGGG